MNTKVLRSVVAVGLLVLAGAGALFGQDVVVEYVDGYLDIDENGEWYPLYIGDEIGIDSTVRLEDGSYAELARGTATVRLRRGGEYQVSSLFEAAGRVAQSGIGAMIASRVSAMTTEQDDSQTAVGGVRASEAVAEPEISWAGGESVADLIDEGLLLLDDGAYQDAYWAFADAYDYSLTDEEYERSAFFLGYASMLIGENAEALELLEEVGPNPETDFYAQHALSLSQLLIQEFAYEDALDVLADLAASAPDDQTMLTANLLRGIAHSGMGDNAGARRFFQQVIDDGAGTQAADAAASILADL